MIQFRIKQLKKDSLGEDTQKKIESMEKAGDSLALIAEKVREIEQGSDFEVHLDFSKVSVSRVLQDVFSSFEFKFINKGVKLELDIKILDSEMIYVDEVILRENIISNLISNALKFSSEGQTVTLAASVAKDKVLISVKDQGIGIDIAFRSDLFNPSIKTTKQGTNGEKGTGFGLKIVKVYTEKMDGELTFNTKTREESSQTGTEFILTFAKTD